MTSRAHVAAALDEELAHPAPPETRGADMAFAACSALSFIAANSAVPLVGGVVAAVGIVQAQHLRSQIPVTSCRERAEEAVAEELASRVLLPEGGVTESTWAWNSWVPWAELCDGEKVEVPSDLPHPSVAGFKPTRLASYVGQRADYACPLSDGRLHAHEYADGSVVLHRDRLDPSRGLATATVHWLSECPEGHVALVLLAMAGIGAATYFVTRW